MRYFFILLLFYLINSCTKNVNNSNNKNGSRVLITNLEKSISFNEYVILLDRINKNKPFPDINDIDE